MKLTEAEWQIMKALWAEWPATARQIADRLSGEVNWAYTTIKTMLTRLTEKKALKETKKSNVSVYEPIISRPDAQRNALKSLVNQAFDGAFGPLMHFLLEDKTLSEDDREQLRQMIETGEQKEQKGANHE
ncbi:MAG: BlaI/MecI/CopY family transcriptional regulator [Planctomycetota bacterium]|jgi:predicted transcriptional regulator